MTESPSPLTMLFSHHTKRREFIAGLGSAAGWPLAASAQQDGRVRALQLQILRLQAEGAAEKIGLFIKEIENWMGWMTQLTWSAATIEQRRFDGLRLLRQVPAISELAQLDPTGKEQLRVSRLAIGPNHQNWLLTHSDYSHEPKFTEAVVPSAYAPVLPSGGVSSGSRLGWLVFVELPVEEVNAPAQ